MSDVPWQSDDTPSIDQLLKIVMIDPRRKVKMSVQLRDEDGDEIPISEITEKITEYVSDRMKQEELNSTRQQVIPLMTQAMVSGLYKLMGPQLSSLLMSQEMTRYSLLFMMGVGFYLLKFIQQKNIKIHTIEEEVTQEEIDQYHRMNDASSIASIAAASGADPKEIVRILLKKGAITREDIISMGAEEILDDDDNSGEVN